MFKLAMGMGAAAVAAAMAVSAARADILVRPDGSMTEGKVVSQDAREVLFQPEDDAAAQHVELSKVSRLLVTDDHGGLVAEKSAAERPATQPAARWDVPPEPAAPPVAPPAAGPTYYLIPLHGEVGVTVLASALEKSFADAVARKATVVVLDISSPGGLVAEAQKIISVLHRFNKQVRIVVLTDQDLSAAAILSLSVKEIYVKPTSTIGAATSYVPGNPALSAKVEEKMQSAWRAVARNSAEEGGHEPLLAEAMIDNTLALHLETAAGKTIVKEGPGAAGDRVLCRAGKILTLTSHEAVECGLAAGDAEDIKELGTALKFPNWTECKGLGTVLADYLPRRAEAFKKEIETVNARFLHDLGEAVNNDPSQAVVTITHTTGVPQPVGPMRPPYGNPRVPMRPGPVQPGMPRRTVTTTVRHSHAHWKAESLACVVALQQTEGDLQQAVALCEAFGQDGQAEAIKEAQDEIGAIRARVYDDRNKYGPGDAITRVAAAPAPAADSTRAVGTTQPANTGQLTGIAPPAGTGVPTRPPRRSRLPAGSALPDNAVKTEQLGGHGGVEYTTLRPAGASFLGFRYTLGEWGGKQVMRKVEPLFQNPPPDAAPYGPAAAPYGPAAATVMARDGYVVGGLVVDTDDKNIVAFKVVFMRLKDGRIDPADAYQSDWAGTPGDRATHQLAGNGETVIGTFGRQGLNLDAMGLVTQAPDAKPR